MARYRVLGSAADLRGSSRHAGSLRILQRLGAIDFSYAREAVEAQNTLEAVLASGQKIQFDSAVKLTLRRPNKLRAEGSGDIVSQIFYYDGKTFALYSPAHKYYANVAAPPTIDAAMDLAQFPRCLRAGQRPAVPGCVHEADPGRDLWIRRRQGSHWRSKVRSARFQRAGSRLADLDRRGRQVGGVNYFYCGGNFYRAAFQGNNVIYVTAQP